MMITLHIFGRMPNVPLPDPSPFCMKAEVLLKMSGLPYRVDTSGFGKAPKGKQPYIVDREKKIPDSTFIRWHLEKAHGVDFDRNLSAAETATAWAFEKMCEDHLYQASISERWLIDENFKIGPAQFFNHAPALLRPLIAAKVRRDVRKAIYAHGIGRHSTDEIAQLAARDIAALAAQLGDKPYFMGQHPTGIDATVFGFVASALCPAFKTRSRTAAEGHPNLVAYRDRMMAKYYPDFVA
jgi:glutathione S-transferase